MRLRRKPVFDAAAHFTQRVAAFEADCSQLAQRPSGERQVVFLGDSLVEGFGARLGWVNRGVASDHLRWPSGNVFERIGPERLHPRPSAIVSLIAVNDLADYPTDIHKHVDSYRELLASLRRLYPGVELAIVSLLPTGGPKVHLNQPIVQLNRALSGLAGSERVPFWDVHSVLYDAGRGQVRPGWLRRDGLHLHVPGYVRLSLLLRKHAASLAAEGRLPSLMRTLKHF